MSSRDYVAFGAYLRLQREARGLSVDQVAQQTKIPPTLVGALESGQGERFPERVFLLNYIRSYAQAVGLSADDTLNRFHEVPEAPKAPEFDPGALESERRAKASERLWIIAAVAAVVTLALTLSAMHEVALRYTQR
jgi:cytoskeletal protein RodZ